MRVIRDFLDKNIDIILPMSIVVVMGGAFLTAVYAFFKLIFALISHITR